MRLITGGSDDPLAPDPIVVRAIRKKLVEKSLRSDRYISAISVRGAGHACSGCDQAITPVRFEMRVRFEDGQLLRFHAAPCFDIWCRASAVVRYCDGDGSGMLTTTTRVESATPADG